MRDSALTLKRAAARLAVVLGVFLAFVPTAARAGILEIWQKTRWGESARDIAAAFGPRATVLSRPIEYGDSIVPVVLPDAEIGGYSFLVYFQIDRAGGGLIRIHFERPRHGAVLGVFRNVVSGLENELGPPSRGCEIPPRAPSGYQASIVRVWERATGTVRAVFRDTTVEATEGCLREERSGTSPCGLTGQIFVQISPRDARTGDC